MNSVIDTIRNLGPARLGAIAVVAIALLASLLFVATQMGTTNLAPLYSGLDAIDSRSIQRELANRNEPFEVRANGEEIFVAADKVNALRLEMAQQGLPSSGVIGNEIFDRDQTLGASNFQQQVSRVRALEGELARSIATLRDVHSARVHIVLPQRELFQRSERPPTASILLNMRGSTRLDREQVQAVSHLVASAVAGLDPNNISILDNRGTLLSRGGNGTQDKTVESGMELQQTFETRLAQRIEEILGSTVGYSGVRAEVTADMDFSQQVIEQNVFDPNGQVVVSTSSDQNDSSSRDGMQDPVSVGNNLPAPNELSGTGGTGTEETTTGLREVTNFQNSSTRTNTIVPPGRVKRLSVAVLVDGVRTPGEEGEAYRARTAEEMEQLTAMVRAAVGYDESRGDVVTLTNQRFADLPNLGDLEQTLLFGLTFNQIQQLLQPLLIGIVVILILLVVVRPLLSRVLESIAAAREAHSGAGEMAMITDQTTGLPVPALPGMEGMEGETDFDSMIDIAHIEGRVKASSMKKIGEIIEKHPEEAVSILRSWMYQES